MFTELEVERPNAMAGAVSEHGATVSSRHVWPWSTVFTIGMSVEIIPRWLYEGYYVHRVLCQEGYKA